MLPSSSSLVPSIILPSCGILTISEISFIGDILTSFSIRFTDSISFPSDEVLHFDSFFIYVAWVEVGRLCARHHFRLNGGTFFAGYRSIKRQGSLAGDTTSVSFRYHAGQFLQAFF